MAPARSMTAEPDRPGARGTAAPVVPPCATDRLPASCRVERAALALAIAWACSGAPAAVPLALGFPESLLNHGADPSVDASAVAINPGAFSLGGGSAAGESAATGISQQLPQAGAGAGCGPC